MAYMLQKLTETLYLLFLKNNRQCKNKSMYKLILIPKSIVAKTHVEIFAFETNLYNTASTWSLMTREALNSH